VLREFPLPHGTTTMDLATETQEALDGLSWALGEYLALEAPVEEGNLDVAADQTRISADELRERAKTAASEGNREEVKRIRGLAVQGWLAMRPGRTRVDLWKRAGHKEKTSFYRWVRGETPPGAAADDALWRIIRER